MLSLIFLIGCIVQGVILTLKVQNTDTLEDLDFYIKLQKFIEGFQKLIIGTLFLTSSIMSNSRLKFYFPDFFYKNRNLLQLSMFGLSLPLYLNGALYMSLWGDKAFIYWTTNLSEYNLLAYFSNFILPISFQLTGLIFGFIR